MMREFLQGWRRKAGVVSLAIACAVMIAWFQSQFTVAAALFSMNGRQHEIMSMRGSLYWFSWKSTSPAVGIYYSEHPVEQMELSLIGELRVLTIDGDPNNRSYAEWFIPHLFVGLPLSILAAYLILWKPRKKAAKPD